MRIEEKTVLVTGCTGFLGGHLIKRLIQHKRTRVRGLVIPKLSRTKQFDELPVQKVYGDMTSFEDMQKATHGCDIVIHCAVGEPNVTVSGTRNAVKAAAEWGVKRFIHISTTAVFGYSPSAKEVKDGRLQGSYHKNKYLNPYCYSKIASENIAFSYYDSHKLPLVILRPANIFGPNSRWWTIAPIRMLEQGFCVLIDGGFSPSNSVYVDNVVDAIELAIQEDNAVGQALTIIDGETTTWKDFFSSYAKMFSNPPPLLNITSKEIGMEKRRRSLELLKKMLWTPRQTPNILPGLVNLSADVRRIVSLAVKLHPRKRVNSFSPSVARKVSDLFLRGRITHTTSSAIKLPDFWLEKTFTLPFHFSNKRAAEILGFRPRVSFEKGMKKTEEWVQGPGSPVFTKPLETGIMSELPVFPPTPKKARTLS